MSQPSPLQDTSLADIDAKLARLKAHAGAWAAQSASERAKLLRACMLKLAEVADDWVAASCAAKRYELHSQGHGEEYLGGTLAVMRNLRLFAEALEAGGSPTLPRKWQRADGQWVVRVFPQSALDKALFTGVTADIWIEPGQEPSQGQLYRTGTSATGVGAEGAVCAVLGAGNQSSIPAMDVLYKLVVDNEVCALKMNPVNAAVGPWIERALSPLVDAGALELVYGGVDQGRHLTDHDAVHSVHITGSVRAHDAIMWGVGEAGERNKRENTPRLAKHISSELGAVSPVFVVPGRWSDAELDYHARNVTAMVTYNAGFNCNSGRALTLASGWPQKDAFMERLRHHLGRTPARYPYYPTALASLEGFTERYEHERCGAVYDDDALPWTVLTNVTDNPAEYALQTEPWVGLISVVELAASTAEEYLKAMVTFGNEQCFGTLATQVLIDPRTEAAHQSAFDEAIAGLRYGTIGINCWSGLGYGLVNTTWGAFPGHPPHDIQSGSGVVHNGLLIDHPQKSVIRTPFVIKPTPAWFTDHKNNVALGQRMTQFEGAPSWLKVPAIALTALKG